MRKSVYLLMLTAWALGFAASSDAQNCPTILQCPISLLTICDPSENDSTLWNEAPYTWSPLLQSPDLYEGVVDLNLKTIVCPGAGNVSISYKIFLDLDSDFLGETVIDSEQPPPAGIVLANNAINPGFMGGDSLYFDKRPIPTASKFRFTLETHLGSDTLHAYVRWNTSDNPAQYLMPRFPEGQHGILWTITQDGVTRQCQYSFKITDCTAPTLICGNNIATDIGPDELFPVSAAQLIDFVDDNVTLDSNLQISMRRAGTGTGFPTIGGSPVTELMLDCSALGQQVLEIWAKDQIGNVSTCNVNLALSDSLFVCTELPKVCARPYWDSTLVIDQVETTLTWVDTQGNLQVYLLPEWVDGCSKIDTFPSDPFYIKQRKSTNLLNGVTTFDLLLISKHILAIEALDAPWKIIAADANLSESVTTNDVVQLRRLILGITNELPGNMSWRFFTDNCIFPPNPFDVTDCSTNYGFDPMPFWAYPGEIRFYGLKTGDVNNSALTSASTPAPLEDRYITQVQWPDITLQAGEVLDIPLRMEQAGNWQGFQCSLPFDATQIEIVDVWAGEQLNPQEFAFAVPEAGMLRVSWFNVTPQVLLPAENLFYLRLKTRSSVRLQDVLALPVDATTLPIASEIYTADNQVRQLAFVFNTTANIPSATQVFNPQPNPFAGGTQLLLRLDQAEQVFFSVGSMEGKILYSNTLSLTNGAHLLDIPAAAFPEKGMYTWQLRIGSNVYQGKLVRL
jgi:hypothetical protein